MAENQPPFSHFHSRSQAASFPLLTPPPPTLPTSIHMHAGLSCVFFSLPNTRLVSEPDGGYLRLYRRPGALSPFARTKALFVAAGLPGEIREKRRLSTQEQRTLPEIKAHHTCSPIRIRKLSAHADNSETVVSS